MGSPTDEDPLTLAIAPPPDETPEQRQAREAEEAEAKRISDGIDDQIRLEREQLKKTKKPVKLLLLGQSESGKTATLKNFQLAYARKEWTEERIAWRAVIYLNLIRNVNVILSHLSNEMSDIPCDTDLSQEDLRPARTLARLKFTQKHHQLLERLSHLAGIQRSLEAKLGSASLDPHSTSINTAAPFEHASSSASSSSSSAPEFSVNSSNGWKSALERFRTRRNNSFQRHHVENGSDGGLSPVKDNDPDGETASVLASCRDDIKALWEDDIVLEVLSRRKVRIEDDPGFFINDAERVADRNYKPIDNDVIRARLRTLGVQEYRFILDHGRAMGHEWRLYDVGGTRSSRAAWYPYFDDVDAIIFLAPISPFDEKLAEDNRVNRLEDSYLLWRSVCRCKLLERAQFILFLNKCDLLQAKLQRGIRIRDSVTSYGDRKNDFPTAARYFQQHFKEICRTNSPVQRPFYFHLTSVIDTGATAITLSAVEESILRGHLRKATLM